MKISLQWLRQFTNIDISVDELVQKIGAQLGAVEEVIDIGAKYKGIVIARVVSCVQHPDADRLHVCLIDDGGVVSGVERNEQGLVQIVCGAPNVREGLLVAWLPPGTTVPSSYDSDPFVLEARALRGVVSNGMLASAKELAIGDDHAGIVEVDIAAAPGTPFAEVYQLDDYVIDIENKMFTHRPDCFGMLGVAREIAGIQHVSFVSPDWYREALDRIAPGKQQLPLEVRNEVAALVPRFMAVAMADVTVRPSPLIMQTYLSRVGIRPINAIVDITNYCMVLTGQPLHAYDYDKLQAVSGATPTLIVRLAAEDGEAVSLLNGKTITVAGQTVVIATDKTAVGIGGVMGAANTEVDSSTTRIVLECATFDMYAIRKTSMRYGLFTDAVTRFNKGQSPLQNDRVLEEAVVMVQSLAGAHVASPVFDLKGIVPDPAQVTVSAAFINERLGMQLAASQMKTLLENVECTVLEDNGVLTVTAPFWRTDIAMPEDIVEEVGRLWGFDHLPLSLPLRDLTPPTQNTMLSAKTAVRNVLSRAGANEVLTYSFVDANLLQKAGQDVTDAYKLSNALSPDLQYYRLSLTPSLLEKVHPNLKAGFDTFALFEINKSHAKRLQDPDEPTLPLERLRVALVYAAHEKLSGGPAYYQAKLYLETLADEFGVSLRFAPVQDSKDPLVAPFDHARAAEVTIAGSDAVLGVIGEYMPDVRRSLKLPVRTAGFEIDLSVLSAARTAHRYQPLPRYPSVTQDISLRVPQSVPFQAVKEGLEQALAAQAPAACVTRLEPLDMYQKDNDTRHLTFRYTIASHERTLTADEVNTVLDRAAAAVHDALGAERI